MKTFIYCLVFVLSVANVKSNANQQFLIRNYVNENVDQNVNENVNENIVLISKSLLALFRAIEYLDNVKDALNVDALIGVGIVSDQLNLMIDWLMEHDFDNEFQQLVLRTIIDTQQQADDLLDSSTVFVQQNYFQNFKGL